MNSLTIYASIHHGNTKKIAETINSELNGKMINFTEVKKEDLMNADLIGFGSGIYIAKFHKELIDFVKRLPTVENKEAFIFSTSGMKQNLLSSRSHKSIRRLLKSKNFKIIDEFNCLGYDTYGPLKLIGGVNKNRPNDKDKRQAIEFALKIKNRKQ